MQPNNDAETFALTNCVTKDFKPCQSDSDQASPKFAIVDGTVWSGYLARVESFKLSARHKGYVDFSFAHDGTLAYELGDSRIKEWSTNGCLDGICAGDVVKYKTSHYNYNVLAVFPKAKKVVIKGIDQAGSKLESLILQDRHDLEKVR